MRSRTGLEVDITYYHSNFDKRGPLIIKMNSTKEQICRLCLKVTKNYHQGIDDTIKQLFDILLLKLDLEITRDPIICRDCVDVAKKCLNFKSVCINTEQIVLLFSAGMRKSKRSIKFIYAAKEQVPVVNDEDLDICRFCMSRLERNNFMPLDTLLNKTMFEMTTKYIPEMDFKIPDYPVICRTCIENLECHSQFILNCLDTEKKIKTYCKEDKSELKKIINLNSILPFLFKDIVEYQIYIKQETNTTEDTDGGDSEAYIGIIKQEELCDEDEETNLCKNSGTYESDMISLKTRRHNIEGHTYQQMVQGNIVEDGFIFGAELEEKWKERSDSQRDHHVVNGDETEQREYSESILKATSVAPDMAIDNYAEAVSEPNYKGNNNGDGVSEINAHQRPLCTYDTKGGDCLKTHVMSIHKDIAKIKTFKCALCTYKTKNKSHLNGHMLVHKDASEIRMFKCGLCAYEAKTKSYLNGHMLVHKEASEIKMFKCALCAYESKRKSDLNRHMSIHNLVCEVKMSVHKNVSEIKMIKCALCTYETKNKSHLNRHMLVHKDASEIRMFKCALCAYETKTKSHLKMHTLVHKDVSEIKMFKCALCTYETKNKSHLNRHMLVHKDASEIKMFKCALCAYESKRKSDLNRHMSIHNLVCEVKMLVYKNVSEIKMIKCALCTYETKNKSHLNRHVLVHTDASEIKMFKCALCPYEAKRKRNLNEHMLVHKDASDIKMFKCALCAYEAKRKHYLKKHMLIHKDVSEIRMFKCALCAYEAKRKHYLKKHMLIHKDVSEIRMFKCALCAYKAKRKSNLNGHMLVHKDASEIKM